MRDTEKDKPTTTPNESSGNGGTIGAEDYQF